MPYLLFAELAVQIISFTATHAVNFCMNFFYYDVQLFLDIELTNSLLPPCCNLTGCCYSNVLKDSHRCVERAMHHNCPVCFEVSGLCSPWHFIISCYTILNSAVRDLEIKKKILSSPSQYLFDSTKDISVLQCGHTIHLECMKEMRAHHQ